GRARARPSGRGGRPPATRGWRGSRRRRTGPSRPPSNRGAVWTAAGRPGWTAARRSSRIEETGSGSFSGAWPRRSSTSAGGSVARLHEDRGSSGLMTRRLTAGGRRIGQQFRQGDKDVKQADRGAAGRRQRALEQGIANRLVHGYHGDWWAMRRWLHAPTGR